jgi:DNA processing protein
MSEINLKHKIALSLIPYRTLIKIPGIGINLARSICERSYLETAEKEVEYVTKNNIRTFFYLDNDYPYRLRQCDDSPVTFYFTGNCDLNAQKLLSVVGTRNATPRGKELCDKIINGLAVGHPDLIIVSGLAYGIDIASHKAALANNLQTIGVLAHGFKTTYPSVHRSTAHEIQERGGLITDFLSDALPERNNFLKRNRIIAGLSDATLVVESGIKGGALITADIAGSYNRDVFAVPGRPGDQWSAGCNSLIKNNKAALIETARDIEYFLTWESSGTKIPVQKTLFNELSEFEKIIYEYLSRYGEMNIDHLCRAVEIPVYKLSALLLQMEFNGIIKCYPGNLYRNV